MTTRCPLEKFLDQGNVKLIGIAIFPPPGYGSAL